MRILLFGGTGKLGSEFLKRMPADFLIYSPSKSDCDFLDERKIRATFREIHPDVVINAAAYTAVDQAELEKKVVNQINTKAVSCIATECCSIGARFVHFSTDYVFSGDKLKPYVERDEMSPLNFYGKSKMMAEEAIFKSGSRNLIMRIGWLYSRNGRSFLNFVLQNLKQRTPIQVSNYQFGTPTSARFVADIVIKELLCEQLTSGVYHCAPAGSVSWYDFAQEIVLCLQKKKIINRYVDVDISQLGRGKDFRLAVRPHNTVLNCNKLFSGLGVEQPCWKNCLLEEMEDLK